MESAALFQPRFDHKIGLQSTQLLSASLNARTRFTDTCQQWLCGNYLLIVLCVLWKQQVQYPHCRNAQYLVNAKYVKISECVIVVLRCCREVPAYKLSSTDLIKNPYLLQIFFKEISNHDH